MFEFTETRNGPQVAAESAANATQKHYIAWMKSALIPQVRIEPTLRAELESVLSEGETLSAFVESSVRKAVEYRRVLRDFDAHCDASLKHFLATGQSYSSAEVLDELRQRTEARRDALLARAATGT